MPLGASFHGNVPSTSSDTTPSLAARALASSRNSVRLLVGAPVSSQWNHRTARPERADSSTGATRYASVGRPPSNLRSVVLTVTIDAEGAGLEVGLAVGVGAGLEVGASVGWMVGVGAAQARTRNVIRPTLPACRPRIMWWTLLNPWRNVHHSDGCTQDEIGPARARCDARGDARDRQPNQVAHPAPDPGARHDQQGNGRSAGTRPRHSPASRPRA